MKRGREGGRDDETGERVHVYSSPSKEIKKDLCLTILSP